MTSIVDDKPPPMNPHRYVNTPRMSNDANRLRQIDEENKDIIKRINIINRMGVCSNIYSINSASYS